MYRNNLDEIRIENLEIFAHHGVFPTEKEQGQKFYVNVVLYSDLRPAGLKDDLTLSTHYGEVSLFIQKLLTEQNFDLIEAAAEMTAREILLQYPLIRALDLELRKPEAPIPMKFSSVSVKIHRQWHSAFIALGSNMGDSRTYIEDAVQALKEDENCRVLKVSDLIITKPYGEIEQADFLNGVLKVDTLYTPHELLTVLHHIEQAAGRKRKLRWGPRTLDLDIIFYDNLICEDESLIIPHVDMHNRDFVLKPMVQLSPYFRHPVSGRTMTKLLHEWEENR
mgnify:FL=1